MSKKNFRKPWLVVLFLVFAACKEPDGTKVKAQTLDSETPPSPMATDVVTLDVDMDGMFALVESKVESDSEERDVVWALMPRLDQPLANEEEEEEEHEEQVPQPRDIPNTKRSLPQHYGFIKLDAKNLAPGDECWGKGEEGAASAPVLLSLSAKDPRNRYPDRADMFGHEIEFEAAFVEGPAKIADRDGMFPDIVELDPERAQVDLELIGDRSTIPSISSGKVVGRVLFQHGEVVPAAPQDGPWSFAYYGARKLVHGNHIMPCPAHAMDCAEVLEVSSVPRRDKLAGRAGVKLKYPRGNLKLHLRPFGGGNTSTLTLCPAGNEENIKVTIVNLAADDLLRRRGDSHRLTESRIEHFLAYYNLSKALTGPNRRLFPLRMRGTSESGGVAMTTGTGGDPYCSITKMTKEEVVNE